MFTLLLAIVATLSSDGANPSFRAVAPSKPAGPDIVVTGTPLHKSREALDACLARHCAPLEDINASLAYAEGLFVAGDYQRAHDVLGRSVERNKRFAATYPVEVAGLYRGYSNVSAHLGEGDDYIAAAYRMGRSIKSGPQAPRAEVMLTELEVGDMQIRTSDRPWLAIQSYEAVSRRAHAEGLTGVAAAADLRLAMLRYAARRTREGDALLDGIIALPGDDFASMRLAARITKATHNLRPGAQPDFAKAFAATSDLPRNGRQMLVWTPALNLPTRAPHALDMPSPSNASDVGSESFRDCWIDVAFSVRSDGRVENVTILRSGKVKDVAWAAPVLRQLAGRVYTPLAPGVTPLAAYRIERFSYTSYYMVPKGTLVRHRDGKPRVERLDLTPAAGVVQTP